MAHTLILLDGPLHQTLKPLTFTRPVAELRVGILTIREKWERLTSLQALSLSAEYLDNPRPKPKGICILVNAGIMPNVGLVKSIMALKDSETLTYKDEWIASKADAYDLAELSRSSWPEIVNPISYEEEIELISRPWHLFQKNSGQIKSDFDLITLGKSSQKIPSHCFTQAAENIFLEDGAKAINCSLNASAGPIYIGKEAVVMEGALIRGPFALLEGAQVKMGAKISDGTTIGPYSKVGGEVGNSILTGYSNKGHDGYLGNSVLGEWCNLGADTNTSNLKNNYSPVKSWSYHESDMVSTGTQFCGLIMGDHSKCGINTMFNTGTVVGVGASIFGGDFPPKHIPSFSWGGSAGFETYKLDKALETARIVMARRKKSLTVEDQAVLEDIFRQTEAQRTDKDI